MVKLVDLTLGYGAHVVVEPLSGAFTRGRSTALVGPNGAGKSTLLKAIAGEIKPLAGHVRRDLDVRIGYLPQQAEIDRGFPIRVSDMVGFGLWHRTGIIRGPARAMKAEIAESLDRVGMADCAQVPIAALSGGQFQRILFARLLLQDAELLLLDEPFAGIDRRTTDDLLVLLRRWQGEGRTVIAALHDLEQACAAFPETLLLAGRAVAWGPTTQVLNAANLDAACLSTHIWHVRAKVASA